MQKSPPRYAPMTTYDQRAARKRIMMMTKKGYDDQLEEKKTLSSSDAFTNKKDLFLHRDHSYDMAILSYNNKTNDKGWKEVIDHERNFKRDTQQKYKQMLDEQIKYSQYLQSQGTMTAAEKHLNKRELKNFKNIKEERRTNSM